jgi:CspA family cold shock protein
MQPVTHLPSGKSRLTIYGPTGAIVMPTGTVKWFNPQKGFGFISQDGGGPDAFVHVTAVERSGIGGLNEGQRVQYDLVNDPRKGKSSAENLKAL